MAVKPGDILGDKYRIDALIGRGGMGNVYAATDMSGPAPPVAIKVVNKQIFDETLMARLHREAEAASRIRSDYVPHVFEVSDTEDKEMYMVMERLVGEPLSAHMREKGPLPWDQVARIGQDVLRGLIDAHTAGVVHRDIKPSNVFLALKNGRPRAMVLDFGVCKTDAVDHERLTGTGEAIGTVAYMAPEQIRGASKVDDRADLYSFGVLVFEMLTGKLPHDGPSQMAILASKLENVPPRLRASTRVAVPDGLDELVARMLSRDPGARHASAQELLKAWRKLGAADLGASMPPGGIPNPVSSEDLVHDAPTEVSVPLGGLADASEPELAHEPHPTQTALTAPGISLRRGGPGRLAVILAACALFLGVVSMIAFFARGPDAKDDAAKNAVVAPPPASVDPPASAAIAEPPPASSSEEPAPASTMIELAEPPASAAKGDPRRPPTGGARTTRPRTSGPAAPRSSGPHITSQPRY